MKFIFIIILSIYGCSYDNSNKINEAEILATIGDRIITINDFIKRSEYNVRPSYCNGNSIEDKRIILNSLIAEKLIALNYKTDFEEFHHQLLLGRKEQKMREVLYNRDIYNKVKLDSLELEKVYSNSRKKFTISYITLPEKENLVEIQNSLEDSVFTFEEVAENIYNVKEVPTRNINYDEHVTEDLYKEFFSNDIQIGQIFGPVMVGDYYSIFRVDDWIETRNLSATQSSNEISRLKESIKDIKARIDYRLFINSIMQGKNLKLHAENFEKLVMNIHTDIKIKTLPLAKSELKIKDIVKNKKYSLNLSMDDIIFNISNKVWTIENLNDLIVKDPININRKLNKTNLKKILKESIIKKLETYYITKKAYERNIDQHYLVNQEEIIWSDYIKSTQVIANMSNTSGLKIAGTNNKFFNEVLNPLFDSLIVDYPGFINVNENYFSDINLSSIDMHVFYKQQSHSLVVPLFPITTTRQELEYLN